MCTIKFFAVNKDHNEYKFVASQYNNLICLNQLLVFKIFNQEISMRCPVRIAL